MNRTERMKKTRRLTYAALYFAIAMVLPFVTGNIPQIGSMLCPMHIPVLLCGFVCGWPWGLAVGFFAPVVRSLLFGMPKLYPSAIAMTFELAAYGALSGLMYRALPKKIWAIYLSLIAAMLAGRLVWGGAEYLLLQMQNTAFTSAMFFAGAVTTAIPGIILHIVLIPILVIILKKAGLTLNDPPSRPI